MKAINTFDIFFLGHFCVFTITTRVLGHYLFMFLEIRVVKSIFSLKTHTFIQSFNANYLNSLFLQPDCQILCYREHRFKCIHVIVEPGFMCREHGSFDYFYAYNTLFLRLLEGVIDAKIQGGVCLNWVNMRRSRIVSA